MDLALPWNPPGLGGSYKNHTGAWEDTTTAANICQNTSEPIQKTLEAPENTPNQHQAHARKGIGAPTTFGA